MLLLLLLLMHRGKQHVQRIDAHVHRAHAHWTHVHTVTVSSNTHLQLKIVTAPFFRVAQYGVRFVEFLERTI